MRGLTVQIKKDMARRLTEGMARGLNPLEIARTLNQRRNYRYTDANVLLELKYAQRYAQRVWMRQKRRQKNLICALCKCTFRHCHRLPGYRTRSGTGKHTP